MSLQRKILQLKLEAAMAARLADGWQKCIDQHGETKATDFYKHLGLNHLEAKSVEWEGLTLHREPNPHEVIAVKGVAQAQESSKEAITKILLDLREQLISAGLKGIRKLSPADYHELTLSIPDEIRSDLRDRLIKVHRQGRLLVAAELTNSKGCNHNWSLNPPYTCYRCLAEPQVKAGDADDFDDLDMLTDLTDARVANDVQARIVAAAARNALLGLTGGDLIDATSTEINAGSVSYIDRAASGLANRVISIGRSDEAEHRSDEWDRVEYSAILDANCCDPCAAEDGATAVSEDDLQPAPNPECLGGDNCRCFHVFINQ